MITFRWASPQASFTRTISSMTRVSSPARNASREMTMSSASRTTPISEGYTHTAAHEGISGVVGAGQTALAHRLRTLPGVSAPSRVVRSTIDTARRMPCCLAVVLMERLPSRAARSSMPTRSTCGRRRITCQVWRAPRARGSAGRRSSESAAMPRAAVIVLDACGVGALPDADLYEGDAGANTLGHLAERVGGLDLPTLERLGLGSIIPIE